MGSESMSTPSRSKTTADIATNERYCTQASAHWEMLSSTATSAWSRSARGATVPLGELGADPTEMFSHYVRAYDLDLRAPAGELLRDHLRHGGRQLDQDVPVLRLGQDCEVGAPSFAQGAKGVRRHADKGANAAAVLLHSR